MNNKTHTYNGPWEVVATEEEHGIVEYGVTDIVGRIVANLPHSYDAAKHVSLIAAAPDMLKALVIVQLAFTYGGANTELSQLVDDAVAKAHSKVSTSITN